MPKYKNPLKTCQYTNEFKVEAAPLTSQIELDLSEPFYAFWGW